MPLHIRDDGTGTPGSLRIRDAETGEDLTTRLHITRFSYTMQAGDMLPRACMEIHLPHLDVVVESISLREACPYCRQVREKTLRSAQDYEDVEKDHGKRG